MEIRFRQELGAAISRTTHPTPRAQDVKINDLQLVRTFVREERLRRVGLDSNETDTSEKQATTNELTTPNWLTLR